MKDLYLRFKDKKEAISSLVAVGFEKDEYDNIYRDGIAVDMVGVIVTTKWDGDTPVYENEAGYHVNLRLVEDGIDVSALSGYIITPETPSRVWA